MNAATLIARTATLEHGAIHWHARRYESANLLQRLIVTCQSAPRGEESDRAIARHFATAVRTIAAACVEDGADWGFIPCLAEPHLGVWNDLLATYGDNPDCEDCGFPIHSEKHGQRCTWA